MFKFEYDALPESEKQRLLALAAENQRRFGHIPPPIAIGVPANSPMAASADWNDDDYVLNPPDGYAIALEKRRAVETTSSQPLRNSTPATRRIASFGDPSVPNSYFIALEARDGRS